MHEKRPIATDVARSVVCVSVRVSVVSGAKTAEPIEMLFGARLMWVQRTIYWTGTKIGQIYSQPWRYQSAMRPFAKLLWALVLLFYLFQGYFSLEAFSTWLSAFVQDEWHHWTERKHDYFHRVHYPSQYSDLFPFLTTSFMQMTLSSSLSNHSTWTQAFLTFKTLFNGSLSGWLLIFLLLTPLRLNSCSSD